MVINKSYKSKNLTMKITRFSLFLVASTAIFALLTVSSCKKSSNNSSSSVSATVSGTAFSPTVTQGFYSQSEEAWDLTGFSVKSGDTSAIEVTIFKVYGSSLPQFTVGKPFTTDTTSAAVSYFTNGSNGKIYWASNGNGFAKLTVTSLDSTGHKIAGTFSGTLYATGTDSVIVTNGNFNTSYTVEP